MKTRRLQCEGDLLWFETKMTPLENQLEHHEPRMTWSFNNLCQCSPKLLSVLSRQCGLRGTSISCFCNGWILAKGLHCSGEQKRKQYRTKYRIEGKWSSCSGDYSFLCQSEYRIWMNVRINVLVFLKQTSIPGF